MTKSGTAEEGRDFKATSGVARFGPWERFVTVRVWLIDDDEEEEDETFTIHLSSPGEGAQLGASDVCTVTIKDDDLVGVLSFEQVCCEPAADAR